MCEKIYFLESPHFNSSTPEENYIQANKEMRSIYRQLKYLHDKQEKANITAIVGFIGLSKYVPDFVQKRIISASAKGGTRTEFIRTETPYLKDLPINHETDIHLHSYFLGIGASALCNKIIKSKNQKYGRASWKVRTRDIAQGLPVDYVKSQSINFMQVGDIEQYQK